MKKLALMAALAAPVTALAADSIGSVSVAVFPAQLAYTNPAAVIEVPVQANGCIDIYSALPDALKTYEEGHLGGYDLNFHVAFKTSEALPISPLFHHYATGDTTGVFTKSNLTTGRIGFNDLTKAGEVKKPWDVIDIHGNRVRITYTEPAAFHGFGVFNVPAYLSYGSGMTRSKYQQIREKSCGLHVFGHVEGVPTILDDSVGIRFEPLSIGKTWAANEPAGSVDLAGYQPGAKVAGNWLTNLPEGEPLSVYVSQSKPKEKLDISFVMPIQKPGVYQVIQRQAMNSNLFRFGANSLTINGQAIEANTSIHEDFRRVRFEPFHVPESGLIHVQMKADVTWLKPEPRSAAGIFRALKKHDGLNEIAYLLQYPDGTVKPITTADMYIPVDR